MTSSNFGTMTDQEKQPWLDDQLFRSSKPSPSKKRYKLVDRFNFQEIVVIMLTSEEWLREFRLLKYVRLIHCMNLHFGLNLSPGSAALWMKSI